MNPGIDRFRYSLTPAGAGVLTLAMPGLLVAMAAQQRALVAVGIAATLVLVVDAVAPRWLIARPVLSASGPTNTTVGAEFRIRLDCRADRRLECVIGVEGAARPWVPALLPAVGEIPVTAAERGVIDGFEVQLQTSVPFGLLACVRTTWVDLVAPVHVEPRRVPVVLPSMAAIDPNINLRRGDELVGVRPYAVGDAPRDVHWLSVARTGSMVVRDRRRTAAETELDVVIETFRSDCNVPQMLGQARSALEQLLAAGYHIRLVTVEADPEAPAALVGAANPDDTASGVHYAIGLLSTPAELGVRLSRVVVGRPGHLAGAIGSSVRLQIQPEGLTWQSSR